MGHGPGRNPDESKEELVQEQEGKNAPLEVASPEPCPSSLVNKNINVKNRSTETESEPRALAPVLLLASQLVSGLTETN